jgi:O-antigen/teichoic acid export membrane protein
MTSGQGHARRLASGSLAQQASQVTGLLTMFAIVTVLARELTLAELGVYGLLTSLAGYLLIVQNAGATGAVRNMAAASGTEAREVVYSTAAAVYAVAGLAAGLAIALLGTAVSLGLDLPSSTRDQALIGSALLGAVTAAGWPLTVFRDALRASQLFVLAAGAEIAALIVYAGLVLGLALSGAPLSLIIGASGGIPLLAGGACGGVLRARRLPYRLRPSLVRREAARELLAVGGWVSLTEVAAAAIYVINRAALGLFGSAAKVGLYEGPVRAHNLLRSLNAATTVTALPAAAGFVADGDRRRLGELLLRGCRYSLALTLPLAVTGMVLSAPLLDVWLGNSFRTGSSAMSILLAHWTVNGCTGVLAAVIIAGGRARDLARYAALVAVGDVAVALAFVPWLGVDGAALAITVPYLVMFPYLVGRALPLAGTQAGVLLREAFLPSWSLGLGLAAGLGALRLAVDLDTVQALAGVTLAGLALYWLAFYVFYLRTDERRLVRDVVRGRARG